MQKLEQAVNVFCIACLCAELLSQLVQDGWAQRCIKMAAGLYILVVFAGVLPGARAAPRSFVLPQVQPASLGTLEDTLAAQTRQQLEQTLAQQLAETTGLPVEVSIQLELRESGLVPLAAELHFPAGCDPAALTEASTQVQQALGLAEGMVRVVCEQGETE